MGGTTITGQGECCAQYSDVGMAVPKERLRKPRAATAEAALGLPELSLLARWLPTMRQSAFMRPASLRMQSRAAPPSPDIATADGAMLAVSQVMLTP